MCYKTYFGAANGFYGFRSNFDKIFLPDEIDKLFVIKGGPGTGKSTLMRKIKEYYSSECDITTILCSSDPDSLDGLLIQKYGVTVGIADGTAPHVIEPQYPGATEEIVNLGDAFDFKFLRSKKEEIILHSSSKKSNYKSAYASLEIAGMIYEYITNCFLNLSHYNVAEREIQKYLDQENERNACCMESDFLIGSFSKNGYRRLYLDGGEKNTVFIKGDGISEYLFMQRFAEKMKKAGISHTVYPSAFSSDLPDALATNKYLYVVTDNKEYTVDTTKFIPKSCEYDRLKSSYKNFIENAQIALIKASESHFNLEAIYSAAMTFDMNEEKYVGMIKEIDAVFDK